MGRGGLFLRKARAKISEEPTGFVWVEKDALAASGYPASKGQVQWLVAHGIYSILTLTESPLPEQFTLGTEVRIKHLPMKDHAAPDLESLERASEYLIEELKSGRRVVVHCLAGEGRTGCVLGAYMIRTRGLTADEVMKILREIKPAFVEPSQEESLHRFSKSDEKAT